jgi:hypothetical protein
MGGEGSMAGANVSLKTTEVSCLNKRIEKLSREVMPILNLRNFRRQPKHRF